MKSESNLFFLLLILFFQAGCHSRSEREEAALRILRTRFPKYEFSRQLDFSDVYLKVKFKDSARLDSLELKNMYDELSRIRRDTINNGQPFVNWIYLVVFDKDDKYLFTIVKDHERLIFFTDGSN